MLHRLRPALRDDGTLTLVGATLRNPESRSLALDARGRRMRTSTWAV